MTPNEELMTLEIVKLRDAIKRKYYQMRYGEMEEEETLAKRYKPIVKEISKISFPTAGEPMKTEEPMETEEEEEEVRLPPPEVSFIDSEIIAESPSTVKDVLSTPEGRIESVKWINSMFKKPITRNYMLKLMKDTKGVIDHTYGPRLEQDSFMVGNEVIQFTDEGDIRIGEVTYRGTRGLYELLFKKIPKQHKYDHRDLDAYKDILIQTNAHKYKYEKRGRINRNPRSDKYKSIIQYIFPVAGRQVAGNGMIEYAHWDDVNELCSRLQLLISSYDAGHTGHANEIASIIEELREAGYIKGSGNRKIRALIR